MATKTKKINVGDTFHYQYADSNPLWKVIKSKGKGVWLCEIQNEPIEFDGRLIDSDWNGTQRLFSTKQLQGIMQWESHIDDIQDKHENFYQNLQVGQRVHYDNGFNQWVRCVVVKENGQNKLRPIALLGNWQSHDLPQRNNDGSIYYPYYPRKILEKESFAPSASSIYENTHKTSKGIIDPNTLPVIDLSVPPMTSDEECTAKKWQTINEIRQTIEENEHNNPQTILDTIKELLNK